MVEGREGVRGAVDKGPVLLRELDLEIFESDGMDGFDVDADATGCAQKADHPVGRMGDIEMWAVEKIGFVPGVVVQLVQRGGRADVVQGQTEQLLPEEVGMGIFTAAIEEELWLQCVG